jgi:pyruvate kinase
MKMWKRLSRKINEDTITVDKNSDLEASIALTTCMTAMQLDADAIVAYTHTGSSARKLSGLRPKCPIFAVTDSVKTYHQLSVSWNVYPVLVEGIDAIGDTVTKGIQELKKKGILEKNDTVVLSGGAKTKVTGTSENKVIGGVVRI